MTKPTPSDLKKLRAWRRLAQAQAKILAAYLMGRPPSKAAFDQAREAKRILIHLGEAVIG